MTARQAPSSCERNNVVVNALRASAPIRPEPVSSSTDSGSAPAAMRAAAASINKLLLPVPGPPSTRTTPRKPGSTMARASGPQRKDIAA
jgi:hypothetical protein